MTHYQRKQRRRARHGGKVRNTALIAAGVVLAIVGIGIASVVGYVISIAATTPNIDELKPIDKGATSAVYAANGHLLGYVQSSIVRQPVLEQDIPQNVRTATVAIEDSRFYKHHGVDFEGIVRAALKNLESHKTVQGGSTITQQLVRSLYIKDPRRDFKRKIREAKLASELEDMHPKHWILTEYLNNIPYGTVNGETAVGMSPPPRSTSTRTQKTSRSTSRRCSPGCRRRRPSTTRSRTRRPRWRGAARCSGRWSRTTT